MSIETYAELSYGELPEEYDNSVANPFRALLNDPEAQLLYLIELYPYDPEAEFTLVGDPPFGSAAFGEADIDYNGGESPVYLSDVGFVTKPDDELPNIYFKALVDNPLQVEASVLSGDSFGNQAPSFGSIMIKNGDGELDDLERQFWPGRRIVVKTGSKEFAYSNFATVFSGVVNTIEATEGDLILSIMDNSLRTEQLIEVGIFAGTGGLEGGDDLANKPKPLCFGKVFNIEPILVDAANLIYQINDGAMDAVIRVLDSGVELTAAGDVADITATSVSAGQYKTQLSGGYIKLGSTPSGRITADARGDTENGYKDTVSEIAQEVLTNRLGLRSFSSGEIDGASLVRLGNELTGTVGIYITERVTAKTVLDELIIPCGAYWTFTRQGSFYAGYIDEPGLESFSIDQQTVDDDGIVTSAVLTPAWRISVGYAPVGILQKEDELAGATTDADRAFLGEQFRYVVAENRSVRTQNAHSKELQFLTRLTEKADAEALLDRLQRIYQEPRKIYRVDVIKALFRVYIGDTIKLTYPRFNLNSGKNFLVAGVAEDAETGTTTFELWG